MSRFSNHDLQKCAEREVGQRKYVYERRVAEKRMTQEKADKEIAMMTAIAGHFREKAEADRRAGDLLGQAPVHAHG